jgi:hypothetical protein
MRRQIRVLITEPTASRDVLLDVVDGGSALGEAGRDVERVGHRHPSRAAPRASTST